MSDRDLRQLELMRETLQSFDLRRGDLDALASNLLNLRDALEEADSSWEHEFTQSVATLDSASQTTSSQRAIMGDGFARLVDTELGRLRQLVEEAIAIQPTAHLATSRLN